MALAVLLSRLRVKESQGSIGQAVFVQTDQPDFAERAVRFTTLEEMVRICGATPTNAVLDKVLVCGDIEGESCVLTLNFIATTKGEIP
jgi:hypothetical protein